MDNKNQASNTNIKHTRLNKYLSEVGYCSRRQADHLITEGKIKVNGKIPEMGMKVSIEDEITVKGEIIQSKKEDFIYIALNKPIGIVCTTASNEPDNIIDFINYKKRIFPIGRLDKPSEGLILLTNDGDIVNKILRSRNNHEKEYLVTVNKIVSNDFIQKMQNGIPILGTMTKKCKVTPAGKYRFKIILTQGLNRQIRRMCEHLGYTVTKLKRTRIMHIELKNLAVGEWRYLTSEELKTLNNDIQYSSKTTD